MPGDRMLTYADLAAFPDDGLRREIIDGELFVSPSPRVRHQEIVVELIVILRTYTREHGGKVFVAPLDVMFSETNVVEPDLIFVADSEREVITEMNLQGAPSLLVEVVSDSRMDRVRKRDLYERFGVREYWVVDPDADRIEVNRLEEGGYGKPVIFVPGETLETPEMPGLRLDVASVFAP